MKVVGLHHAGVVVANLERSIAFYGDVFGLEVAERLDVGGERLAFLQVGPARLELIESAPQAPRRTGLLRHLEQRGVTLVDREPIDVPGLNARILFCLGPRWRAHRALRARSAMSHEPSAVSRQFVPMVDSARYSEARCVLPPPAES